MPAASEGRRTESVLIHARRIVALTLALCATASAQEPASRPRPDGEPSRVRIVDVVDERGASVAGARVSLLLNATDRMWWSSDNRGRVSFTDVDGSPFALLVEASGFRRTLEPIASARDPDAPLRVALRPAVPFEVRVVDDDGPVQDVGVEAELDSELAKRGGAYAARTYARLVDPGAGEFRFEDSPAGPWSIHASSDRHEVASASFAESPTSPHFLRLRRLRRYAVTVVAASTSRPIKGALVRPDDFDAKLRWTDSEGRVELHVARDVGVIGVSAHRFCPVVVELAGRTSDFVVALRETGDVLVRHETQEPRSGIFYWPVVFAAEGPDGSPIPHEAEGVCKPGRVTLLDDGEPIGRDTTYLVAPTGPRTLFVWLPDQDQSLREIPRSFAPVRLPAVFRADVVVRAEEPVLIDVPRAAHNASVYLTVAFPRNENADGDLTPICTVAANDGRRLAIVPDDRDLMRAVDRVAFPFMAPFDDGRSPVVRGLRTLVVAPGPYDLTVAFPGCAAQTRRVTLRAGERTSEAFELAAERK
jgi:hypothetical protein